MGRPFVLPEGFAGLVVALPVGVHVIEQIGLAGVLDQGGDVGVVTRRVAFGLVGAIAVIGPVNMQLVSVDRVTDGVVL